MKLADASRECVHAITCSRAVSAAARSRTVNRDSWARRSWCPAPGCSSQSCSRRFLQQHKWLVCNFMIAIIEHFITSLPSPNIDNSVHVVNELFCCSRNKQMQRNLFLSADSPGILCLHTVPPAAASPSSDSELLSSFGFSWPHHFAAKWAVHTFSLALLISVSHDTRRFNTHMSNDDSELCYTFATSVYTLIWCNSENVQYNVDYVCT